MNATFTLYSNPDVPGAFGYFVESDVGHCVIQDYAPSEAGHDPMSEAEATPSLSH